MTDNKNNKIPTAVMTLSEGKDGGVDFVVNYDPSPTSFGDKEKVPLSYVCMAMIAERSLQMLENLSQMNEDDSGPTANDTIN